MDDEHQPVFSWLMPWNWGGRRYIRVVAWWAVAYVVSFPVVDALLTGRMGQGSWLRPWFQTVYAPLILLINTLLNDHV